MTTVVTGAGLIGTAFAQNAIARGEKVVFVDPEPRADFLKLKLGDKGYALARYDVRDLPNLIATIKEHGADTVVHTAGLIGNRVQQSLSAGFDINLGGTRNVAEAVRLTGVRRLVHISTFGVYDRRREEGNAPVAEDFTRGGSRAYGAFKAAKELILEAYAAAYKFEVIMLRPANVFGLGHFAAGSSGGMKMQRLVEAALDGGARPTLRGRARRSAARQNRAARYLRGETASRLGAALHARVRIRGLSQGFEGGAHPALTGADAC
jgi:nucleoside-diphosphate-sugar epimerase